VKLNKKSHAKTPSRKGFAKKIIDRGLPLRILRVFAALRASLLFGLLLIHDLVMEKGMKEKLTSGLSVVFAFLSWPL